jgi:hypothetical protein
MEARRRSLVVMATISAGLLAGCQSHRALPPAPPSAGLSPLGLRLESTRFHLFSKVRDDLAVERVFAGPGLWLVTANDPAGVFASAGGDEVTFAPLEAEEGQEEPRRGGQRGGGGSPVAFQGAQSASVRVLREVLFAGPPGAVRAFGLRAGQLFCSDEGARAFTACAPGGTPVEALAVDRDGQVLAAGGGALFVSADGGRGWARRPIKVPGLPEDVPVHVRALAVHPRGAIFAAIRNDPANAGAEIAGLVDGSSGTAYEARSFEGDLTALPRTVSFGVGQAIVLVSHDGGASWKRTGMALDAWLAFEGETLWAVAADPVLEAAALVRQNAELAAALARQLKSVRVEAGLLRAALKFPGRARLLAGPLGQAPVFRSTDDGATWTRTLDVPASVVISLRAKLDRQRASIDGVALRRAGGGPGEAPEARPGGRGGGERGGGGMGGGGMGGGGRGGRGGGGGGPPGGGQRQQARGPGGRFFSAEALLAYLDPARLLARFNGGRALSGVVRAGQGEGFIAWTPTEPFWNQLADAAVAESDAEGEISLGPAQPQRLPEVQPFELLRSADGAAWNPVPEAAPLAIAASPGPGASAVYPEQAASDGAEAMIVASSRDRLGRLVRRVWRIR